MSLTRKEKRTVASGMASLIFALLAMIAIGASVLTISTRKAESKSDPGSASSQSKLSVSALRADRMKHTTNRRSESSAPLILFATIDVDRTDDLASASACTAAPNDCSLRGATKFANANAGTTINLPAGTYQLTNDGSAEIGFCLDENLGDLNIAGNNTSIVGAGAATTIIQQTTPNDRVLCVDANLVGNFNFSISGVTITGGRETNGVGGGGMISGGFGDVTTVTDCIFTNNQASGGGSPVGGGIGNGAGTLIISGTRFSNNTAAASGGGVYQDTFGAGTLSVTNSTFENNNATNGNGGGLIATATFGGGPFSVTSSSFVNNNSGGSNTSGGGLFKQSGSMTVSLNSFANNSAIGANSRGGGFANGNGVMTANYNRVVGNTATQGSGASNTTGSLDANDNWWGCSSGPSGPTGAGCTVSPNGTFGTVVVSWLQLRHSAGDPNLCADEATTLTADIKGRNIGAPLTSELNGLATFPATPTAIFSNPSLGTLSGASTQFVNGVATATFTAGTTTGTGGADATADNQTESASVSIQNTTTTKPDDQTVCQGTDATFSTTASGGSSFTYAWTLDGNPIGGNTSSITIPTGSLSGGNHTVTVTTTGDCGSDTESATLTVQAGTTATDLVDATVCQGTTANFSTTATGENLHYAWTLDGVAFGGDTPNISVPTGSLSVGGHPVTVTVSGTCGIVVRNATLTVQENTSASTPADQTVCKGDTATFSTSASGAGTLHYAWTVDGAPFGGDTPSINVPTGSLSVGNHPVTVTVSGTCGIVVRNSNLTVNAPTATTDPVDVSTCEGQTASFSTTASGTGPFSFVWKQGATVLVSGSLGGRVAITNTATTSTLTISNVQAADAGIYTVETTGSCNTATQSATLGVNTAGPVITLKNVNIQLWPPNHKYKTITVGDLVLSASDACDAGVNLNSVKILRVTSDELDDNPNGGDGNTSNDIVIAPDCKSVQLRAERDGNLDGRVYKITFIATDSFGHSTTVTASVTVPHSQNGNPAVDSGINNTVNGNCP